MSNSSSATTTAATSSSTTANSDLQSAKTLFTLGLYALELALGVFAFVALFHIIDEYNMVLLVLNLVTLASGIALYCILRPENDKDRRTAVAWQAHRRFLRISILSSLLLSILRATWQVMVASDNAENISPVNDQEYYFSYLAMAIFRVVWFSLATDRLLDIVY